MCIRDRTWSGDVVVTRPADPDPSGEPYRTATVTVQDGWRYVFEELPQSGELEDGSIVYYSYFVSEDPVQNYTTSYENNGGITGGTVTVINKADLVPGHEMPKTGGSSPALCTAGGLTALCAGLLLLLQRKKRGKEDFASS